MKITKSKLKQIIKEELSRVMREDYATDTKLEVEHLKEHGPKRVLKYYNEYLKVAQHYDDLAKKYGYHLKINVGLDAGEPEYVADEAENTYIWHVYYTIEAQDKNGDIMKDHQGYPLDGRTEYGVVFDIEGQESGYTPSHDKTYHPKHPDRPPYIAMKDHLEPIISQLQRAGD